MERNELKEYRMILKELDLISCEIKRLNSVVADIGACAKSEALRREYELLWSEIYNKRLDIERAIASLSPTDRVILRLRYFEGLSWTAIAMRVSYSVDRVKHRAGMAERSLAKKG